MTKYHFCGILFFIMSLDPERSIIEQVGQASSIIAMRQEEGWERFGVNAQDYQGNTEDLESLSLTAVYRIPEQTPPKLRKATFRNSRFATDAIMGLEGHFAADIMQEYASLGHSGFQQIIEQVDDALEETRAHTPKASTHEMVAMFAIFNASGNTVYAYTFARTNLLDAIAKRVDRSTSNSEIAESVLKDMYAAESEQLDDIEPYDEWRQLVLKAISVPQEERPKHSMAETCLRPLLLPTAYTDPSVNRVFFA